MNRSSVKRKPGGAQALACQHHWLLEGPAGPVSRGICRQCGATRKFKNHIESSAWHKPVVEDDDDDDELFSVLADDVDYGR